MSGPAASPSRSAQLVTSRVLSRAQAAVRGRDYITPDDVKALARPVLDHRVTLSPEAEMEGRDVTEVLRRIFERVEVPR